jgi:hypothetical protein
MAGHVVLCVSYGLTETTALLVGDDARWVPLTFDGVDALSSGVFVKEDGSLLAGEAAWAAAAGSPERFDAAPARWLQQGTVPLPSPVPVWDAVAATLVEVGARARLMLAGAPVDEVRLVVPAAWGPRRRTAMREAAWRADLGQPTLVTSPEAAAGWAAAGEVALRVGAFVAVCELDAAAEVSVLRRGPYGFETLAVHEVPDGGALAWDAAVAADLTATVGDGWAGGGLGLWSAARVARQAAEGAGAVTVASPAGPLVVPAQRVHQAGGAVLHRAAQALAAVVAAAEVKPDDLAAVLCSGRLATPAAVTAIAAGSGMPVTRVDRPEWAALLGAAHLTGATPTNGDTVPEPALPPLQRAATALVPSLASLILFVYFLAAADRNRPVGALVATGEGVLLANWGQLALAALFGLLACAQLATVFAALMPPPDPFTRPDPAPGRGSWWDSQQIGPALAATAATGSAVAGVYAIVGAALLDWPTGPFLRWTLLPIVLIVALMLAAGAIATQGRRSPAVGWHQWLGFPVWSVFTATVGMAAVQASVTTSVYPANAWVLTGIGRAGGALIGIATALALARRSPWRLVLAVPAGVLFAAVTSVSTTGVLAGGYVAAVTVWWARRVWLLANRPRTALPTPK